MNLKYVCLSLEDAFKQNLIDWEPHDEYRNAIFRVEDNKHTLVGIDGGEPEDASFGRNYSWVLSELNYAAKTHNKKEETPNGN